MKNHQARGDENRALPSWIGALCAAVFLCLPVGAGAELPQPPKRGPGATGASGSVLQYEESPGRRIVYFQEAGGVLLPGAEPVPGSSRDDMPLPGSVAKGRQPAAPGSPRTTAAAKPAGAAAKR
jgi:hypothetical protein